MRGRTSWGAGIAATLFVTLAAAVEPAPPAATTPPPPARVHEAGVQLERAVTDVVVACLRNDAPAALAAMERLEASCRKLSRDDVPAPPRDVLVYDQALHTALERSRTLVRTSHVTEAFDQFVWVMRACRQCHQVAGRRGLGPDAAREAAPTPQPGTP